MTKVIPTGWNRTTGFLYRMPVSLVKNRTGILFYSEYNSSKDIKQLKTFAKNFKNVLVIRLEDIYEAGDNNEGPTYHKMAIIKEFIESHQTDDLIVSCFAGISRTGAILDYLLQIHDYELDTDNLEYIHYGYVPNELMAMYLQQLNHDYKPSTVLDYSVKDNQWIINDMSLENSDTIF